MSFGRLMAGKKSDQLLDTNNVDNSLPITDDGHKNNVRPHSSHKARSKAKRNENTEERISQISRDLERGVAILHYVCAFIGDTNYQYNGYYGYFGLLFWCLSLTLHFSFDFYDAFAVYQSAWGPALGVFFVAFCTLSYWTVTRTVPWVAVALRTLRDDSIAGYTYFKTIEVTSFVCRLLPIIVPFVGLGSTGGQYICYYIDNALTVNISSIPALKNTNMTGFEWISSVLSAVRFFSLFHVLSGYWVFNLCQLVLLFLVGMSMIEFQEQVRPKLKSHTGSYTFQQAVGDISNRARFIRDASKSGTHVMTMLIVSSSVSFVLNLYSFFYMKVFAIYMWFAVVPASISLSMLLLSAWVTRVYRNYRVTVIKAWVERKEDSSEDETEDDESDSKSYFTGIRERLQTVFKRKKLKTKKERDFLVLDKRSIMPPHFPIVTMPEIAKSDIYPKGEIEFLKKMDEEEEKAQENKRFSFMRRRRKGKTSFVNGNGNNKVIDSIQPVGYRKFPSTIIIEPLGDLRKSDHEAMNKDHSDISHTNGVVRVNSFDSNHSLNGKLPEEIRSDSPRSQGTTYDDKEVVFHPPPMESNVVLSKLLPPIADDKIGSSSITRRHSLFGRIESTPFDRPLLPPTAIAEEVTECNQETTLSVHNNESQIPELSTTSDAAVNPGNISTSPSKSTVLAVATDSANMVKSVSKGSMPRSLSYTSLHTVVDKHFDDKRIGPVDAMTTFVDQRRYCKENSVQSIEEDYTDSRPSSASLNTHNSNKNCTKVSKFSKKMYDHCKETTDDVTVNDESKPSIESSPVVDFQSGSVVAGGNEEKKKSLPVFRSTSEEGTSSSTLPVSNAWKKLGLKRTREEGNERSGEETEVEPTSADGDENQSRTKYTTAKLLTTVRGISKAFGKVQHKRKMQRFNFRKYIVYLDNFLPTVGYQIGGKTIQRDTIIFYSFFMLSFLALFAQEKLFGQKAQLGA